MFKPNVVVLYVDNIAISSKFYQDLLGLALKEASPTFHSFTLSNGMGLALKAKHAVEPPPENNGASGELAFIVDDNSQVNELFADWQKNNIKIAQNPTTACYGYNFVALDPDGHRLRVVALG